MTDHEFENKLVDLIEKIRVLQVRNQELAEFEIQWSALFNLLESKTGQEVKLSIGNSEVYRSFHWDKYQIIANDLYSLLQNESERGYQDSFLKQLNHHFHLEQMQSYANSHENPYHVFGPLPDTNLEIFEAGKLEVAKRIYKTKVDALLKLFPNINQEIYNITQNDIDDLIKKIVELKIQLKDIRDYFSHRNEETVAPKYASAVENLKAEKFEKIAEELFQILNLVTILYKDREFDKFNSNMQSHISNQIDLILFGSIENSIRVYSAGQSNGTPYSQARNNFFNSDKILNVNYKEEDY